MLLRTHSDASYLSRPNSGSVAGGYQFLGNLHDTTTFNHPILTSSTLIPVIVAPITEAEYATVYASCILACDIRRTLANMGYPQPPTPILTDSECAVGLAKGKLKTKMAKSVNMRLYWVHGRAKRNQFTIPYIPGSQNIAGFFTKPLPNHTHHSLTPYFPN